MAKNNWVSLAIWLLNLAAIMPSTTAFLIARPINQLELCSAPNDPQCFLFWRKQGAAKGSILPQSYVPKSIQIQRRSVASVQTFGLFGLGFGEIALILVVLGAILGPENIGRIVKSGSSRTQEMAEELKRVPEEFQRGVEEGESEARARNAKRIRVVKEDGTPIE